MHKLKLNKNTFAYTGIVGVEYKKILKHNF